MCNLECELLKDETYKEIIRIVDEQPNGIRINDICHKLNKPYHTVRYRIFELNRCGKINIKQALNKVVVFPATATGGC